jgi:hypothetical protein
VLALLHPAIGPTGATVNEGFVEVADPHASVVGADRYGALVPYTASVASAYVLGNCTATAA